MFNGHPYPKKYFIKDLEEYKWQIISRSRELKNKNRSFLKLSLKTRIYRVHCSLYFTRLRKSTAATFYSRFSLTPKGKHKISVCLGTACYVKGSDKILAEVEKKLGIKSGECTPDGLFSIDSCRCVGACGLAPVMMIDEEVYGKLTPENVGAILDKYIAEEGGNK